MGVSAQIGSIAPLDVGVSGCSVGVVEAGLSWPGRDPRSKPMLTAFRGASTHSLDDKARLIVPKRFLEQLPPVESNLVLTASRDGCLLLLEKSSFEAISARIGDDPLDNDRINRDLRRLFLGHAEDVKPDRAGRIVIPKQLQRFMGVSGSKDGKEMVVVGTGRSIELWNPERWLEAMSGASSKSSSFESKDAVGSPAE